MFVSNPIQLPTIYMYFVEIFIRELLQICSRFELSECPRLSGVVCYPLAILMKSTRRSKASQNGGRRRMEGRKTERRIEIWKSTAESGSVIVIMAASFLWERAICGTENGSIGPKGTSRIQQ